MPKNITNKYLKVEQRFLPIAPYGGIPQPEENQDNKKHRACDQCRRMKIKCQLLSGFSNCRRCTAVNKECTFEIKLKKRGPRQGYIGALEDRLRRIEGLINGISEESTKPAGLPETSPEINPKVEKKRNDDSQQPDLTNFYREFTYDGRYIREHNLMKIFLQGKYGMLYQKELQTRHGIDIQYNEKSNLYRVRKIAINEEDSRKHQISELIEVGVLNPHETINDINQWIYKVSGIDRSLSDRLLKIYFAYIHPLLPVINKTEFLEEYRGIRSTYPAGYLLNAIYGAAVRYVENCKKFNDLDSIDDGGAWDFPEGFSEHLFESIMTYIKGKYVPRISTIQSIIIAHNHSANVNNWTSGWLMNCAAVRMCQEIGLHRSANGWNISEQEKETRKMVWWSAYVLDRWFSAGSGRPLNIFDEDCDTEYPSVSVNVDEVMDKMTDNDQYLPRFPSVSETVANNVKEIPLNEPFIQLLKLSEILGFVLQNLYTPKAKKHSAQYGSDSIVAYVNDALSKWRVALPPLFEISKAGEKTFQNKDHDPLVSVSGLICLSYCTLLILLHRPFIESLEDDGKQKSENSSQSSLAICTSAAIRIVEVAEAMHYRDFLLISWGFALYPVFTAALIHIYNCSNSNSIVSDVAKFNLVRALGVMEKLCVLSPIATDMGLVLKKVICESPIFVNDPDFVSKVTINRKDKGIYASHYITMDNETFRKRYEATKKMEENFKGDKKLIDQLYTREQIASLLTKSLMGVCKDDVSKQENLVSELSSQTPSLQSQASQQHEKIDDINIASSNPQHCYTTPDSKINSYAQFTDAQNTLDFVVGSNNSGLLSSAPIDRVSYQHGSASLSMMSTNFFDPQVTMPGLSNNYRFSNTLPSAWSPHVQQDPSAVFRYSPGNPFWAVPTSMEMDEWAVYLFSHQPQDNRQP